eukprot:TRINITY_DN212_c0_g1_i1.p1 TRINITY_DN212_c0_g1~~TRINITY_DN212_c0_g1_i1.p1  ORF type:complete len:128 (-),score=32.10 TRINITY_DN212_c0_g1_i1:97-480(-)
MARVRVSRSEGQKRKRLPEVTSLETTINIGKATHNYGYKKKSPKAIKKIRDFVERLMGTKDVRIDTKLNKFVWWRGIKNPPKRIRVRIDRKRSEDEESRQKLYSVVSWVNVPAFHGLTTKVVDEANE